jgi:hypothetical protein
LERYPVSKTKILALYAAGEQKSSISARSTAWKKEAWLISIRVDGEKGRYFPISITLVGIKIWIGLETARHLALCWAAPSHVAAFGFRISDVLPQILTAFQCSL